MFFEPGIARLGQEHAVPPLGMAKACIALIKDNIKFMVNLACVWTALAQIETKCSEGHFFTRFMIGLGNFCRLLTSPLLKARVDSYCVVQKLRKNR